MCLCVISVFVFGGSVGVFVCWVGLVGGCVCVLGWACWWVCLCVVCSHITQVSILELKLGKKQFKKILKII